MLKSFAAVGSFFFIISICRKWPKHCFYWLESTSANHHGSCYLTISSAMIKPRLQLLDLKPKNVQFRKRKEPYPHLLFCWSRREDFQTCCLITENLYFIAANLLYMPNFMFPSETQQQSCILLSCTVSICWTTNKQITSNCNKRQVLFATSLTTDIWSIFGLIKK